jgi:hypothetical protein
MAIAVSPANRMTDFRNLGDFPEKPDIPSLRQQGSSLPEETRNSAQSKFKPDDEPPTRKVKIETTFGQTGIEITGTRQLPSLENLLPTPQQQRIWEPQFQPITKLEVTSTLKVPTINGSIGTTTTFNSDGSVSSDQKVTFGINKSKLVLDTSTSGAAAVTFSTNESDKVSYQLRGEIKPVPIAPDSTVTKPETELSVQTSVKLSDAVKLNFGLNTNGNVIVGGTVKSGSLEATADYSTFTGDVNAAIGFRPFPDRHESLCD